MKALLAVGGTGFTVGAIVALWRRWQAPQRRDAWFGVALALAVAATTCWVAGFGAEIGVPLSLEIWALVGFGFILTRIERRPERASRDRVSAPPAVARRIRRGVAQMLVAGPLGFAAAVGIASAIATRAPLAEQTRLIGAGLLVPSLWAIFIGWTLATRRLPVPATSMAVMGGAGFGIALLGQG